ncbi:VOC family protein [Paractinoplanes rishiriensis]|uniref:Glyoxalase n=1 Tax=Paractinoplanes rishiriensis TaxID=1050105 RepID=A0A919MZ98_9ACTN|nr:VOC family protein [Actinoplanes rishiriensis]GIF00960.1 glyoxalase [Actinoplanes rishiriensis]
MGLDLYAGIAVADYPAALAWYERLLGSPPSFVVHDGEVVWELAESRSLYVEHLPERAGHAMITVFVGDFEERIAAIAGRGIAPTKVETYDNGVRKAVFHDPEGNEIGFGGGPV